MKEWEKGFQGTWSQKTNRHHYSTVYKTDYKPKGTRGLENGTLSDQASNPPGGHEILNTIPSIQESKIRISDNG